MRKQTQVILGLALLGLLTVVSFNNCARNPNTNASVPLTAFQDQRGIEKTLAQQYDAKMPADFCEKSENYFCHLQIFSPTVATAIEKTEFDCVQLLKGGKLCPAGLLMTHNSKSATENCNNCGESFDYQEFECHLRLLDPNQLYPLVV